MTLLENIAEYLQNNNLGTLGTDMFIGFLADEYPGASTIVTSITQSGGIEPDRYLTIAKPTVQITVRSESHRAGLQRLQDIYDLLHQTNDYDLFIADGEDVMNVFAINEPQHLERDDQERDLFTCTFVFRVRRRVV